MKKPFYNKKEDNKPKVWKSSTGPDIPADWQLKLRAIGDCLGKAEGNKLSVMIENRYQDLWHRYHQGK